MLLAIDVGNTNTVFGVDGGDGIWRWQWRASTKSSTLGNDWLPLLTAFAARDGIDLRQIQAVCLSSVVPNATLALRELCREWLAVDPLIVSARLALPVRLGVDFPDEVGTDRIANATAAWEMCKAACIVVDLGTATKVEAVTSEGVFAGGSIAVGLGVSLEALTARAARLFGIELTATSSAIGRNTTQALQAGLVNGHVHLVNGLINDIRSEIGSQAAVVVTGGHVVRLDSPFRRIGRFEPDLTLNGIRHIYQLNAPGG